MRVETFKDASHYKDWLTELTNDRTYVEILNVEAFDSELVVTYRYKKDIDIQYGTAKPKANNLYCFETLIPSDCYSDIPFENLIRNLGYNNWELVMQNKDGDYIFKREVISRFRAPY